MILEDMLMLFDARTIVTLYMTQAYELVIPIRDMALYDACDRN